MSVTAPISEPRKGLTRSLLSWGILIAFVAGVEWWLGWDALLKPWGNLTVSQLGVALGLLVASYWLRAWRVRDYFREELTGRFLPTFRLATLHNLMNSLLPMRAGEISFPVLMQRYFAIRPARSIPVLLWFRLLDLHAILMIVAGAILVGIDAPGWFWPLWLTALPLPFVIYRLRPHGVNWLESKRQANNSLANEGGRLTEKLIVALNALPSASGPLWRAFFWTWANWLVKLAGLAWVLQAFLSMPTSAAWLGAIAGDLTTVLPIHAPGGFGTYEAGIIAALLPFGLNAEAVAIAAINLHLFLLASSLMAGVLAWLIPVKPIR
ncbi:MAG TPA: flippase-like domain-containing protein [Halothiobacillus sp.]|nr:flippase-like domain-containing protein [Halothiobacillus sp.]